MYLACGHTDMRKGMATLAMLVQQTLGHDPFSGAVYAFRGHRGQQTTFSIQFSYRPESRIPGIRYSGRRCRCRPTAAGRICNVSTRTTGPILVASFRPGCSMKATARACRSASRRSALQDYSSLPPLWRHSRLRHLAHDRILQRGRRETVRRSPYCNPAQLVLYPEHQAVDRPLSPNPKGLVEALADLLLVALGVQCRMVKGGDDEHQDHA